MAFRCMNCNGHMVFDVTLQKMRCEHCDSVYDPSDFVLRDTSPEAGGKAYVTDEGMAQFTCQNCAATLEATEDSMISICPYCGGQSMVKSASEGYDVERIIPFQVTKERCMELYTNYAKEVRYLPKELKDPEFIQNFTGIYMPFFEYDAEFGSIHVTGSKTVESNSSYDVINDYLITGEVEGTYPRGVVFDGSRYLDDETSARTLPYDYSYLRPFNPAYLSGFYADTSTVDPARYYEAAAIRAEEDMMGAVRPEVTSSTGIRVNESSTVETQITGHHPVLYPMWFLTWRKDDRVAYAVINGQSGEVVSDLPLDFRSFAVGSAIAAVLVFLVMEFLFQPTPLVTSLVSLGAAFFMALGIRMGAQREFEQQTHANDEGWSDDEDTDGTTGKPKEKKKRKRRRSGKEILSSIGSIALFVFGIIFFFGRKLGSDLLNADLLISALRFIVPIVVIGYAFSVLARVLRWRKHFDHNDPMFAILALMATVALNTAVVFVSPVNDGWYYLGDAVCILGLVISAIGMIRTYNTSTTRPLPKLFDRTEV